MRFDQRSSFLGFVKGWWWAAWIISSKSAVELSNLFTLQYMWSQLFSTWMTITNNFGWRGNSWAKEASPAKGLEFSNKTTFALYWLISRFSSSRFSASLWMATNSLSELPMRFVIVRLSNGTLWRARRHGIGKVIILGLKVLSIRIMNYGIWVDYPRSFSGIKKGPSFGWSFWEIGLIPGLTLCDFRNFRNGGLG